MAAGKEDSKQDLFLKMYMGGKTRDWFFAPFLDSLQKPQSLHPLGGGGGGAMNSMHLSSLFKKYFEEFLFPLRHGGLL